MARAVGKTKAWAIVSRRGVLIGGGDKHYGYMPLMIFSTREGAKQHLSPTRKTDKIVRCDVFLEAQLSQDRSSE